MYKVAAVVDQESGETDIHTFRVLSELYRVRTTYSMSMCQLSLVTFYADYLHFISAFSFYSQLN